MNLLLSLTERCNLRCSYCYYKDSQIDRKIDMSDEILEASLRLALERTIDQKQSFFNITFFGGEPLLRMDAIRWSVRFVKKFVKENRSRFPEDFQYGFHVNTNGTLLTDEICKFLKKENFKIFLSLDGPERKHNISRRTVDGKGCFKLISPNIPFLTQMRTSVISVVTRRHVRGLSRAVEWFFDQGFKSVTTAVDFDGKWTGEDFDALAYEYQKMALLWLKYRKQEKDFYLGTIQDKISFRLLDVRQKEYSCFIFKGGLGISANGQVFPCSRFITSAEDAKYKLGSVFDSKNKLFNGAVAKDLRNYLKHDKPECDGCAIRYRCSAHECGCNAFYTTGSVYKVSPEVCTHERILAAICDEALAKRQELGELF